MPVFGNLKVGAYLAAPLVLSAAAAFALTLCPVWDYDVWFQLACGKAITALRAIPSHDLFSFTAADRPWDSQEWLSQVAFYAVYSLGGIGALTAMKALVSAVLAILLFRRAAFKMSDPWLTAAVVVWAVYTIRFNLVERPQIFTMVFLAAELLLLSRRRFVPLLPLALVWVNLHGGTSLLCPGVFGIWIACEYAAARVKGAGLAALKKQILVLIALFPVLMMNPAGWRIFTYPFETMADRTYMANIMEWIPPAIDQQPAFFLFIGITVLLIAASLTQFGLFDLAIAVIFATMAFSARRHIPLFVVAAAPLVARAFTSQTWGMLSKTRFPAAAFLAVTVILALPLSSYLKGEALATGVRADLYPAGAVENLIPAADSFPGSEPVRIFNLHKWGGYLAWHLPERFKVFIDGRQLVYGPKIFLDYYLILEDKLEAEALIEEYSPDLFIIDFGTKLGRKLEKNRKFALVYWDDACLVYVPRKPETAPYIKEGEYKAFKPETGLVGNFDKALMELARAAKAAPFDARPLAAKSALLLEKGLYQEAFAAAQEALSRKPRSLPVVLAAAAAALAIQDLDAAAGFVRQAAQINPHATETLLAQARLALAEGRPLRADERTSKAIEAGERMMKKRRKPEAALADAYRLRAFRLVQERRNPEAAEALRKAGNAFFELGRTDQALRAYREAASLAPFDMRIQHNIGSVLLSQGDLKGAEEYFGKALTIEPESVETLTALGVVYARTGREKEAARMFKKALRIRPGDEEIEGYLSSLGRKDR